ncbi:hypothetical protein GCM10007116_15990 [Sulfodiicoccus acidiphilus]|uniref:NADH:ubiquinone oxidoreductase 30kDa subunit domain-containing protein n=1 Tax=Sulfodiicoccus acidiphilus TaxID=1670455 RepID=A0A830H205_9CREN|nr:hypothetical protein GCM10007116_15990 [Sulfodiicoccus acidiphilus]
MTQPNQPTTQPNQPTTQPNQPTTQPNQPTTQPNQPTTQPNQPTTQPTKSRFGDKLLQELKNTFGIEGKAESDRRIMIEIPDPAQIRKVAEFLREKGIDHVKSITGIDYPDQKKFSIVYHVSSYGDFELAKLILSLRTYVPYERPEIETLYEIWPSVWTFERETYEMLGITFKGHPDLRRMFLPEDFEGVYPLRKSFKVKQEALFIDKQA